jgi:hypothetical protein
MEDEVEVRVSGGEENIQRARETRGGRESETDRQIHAHIQRERERPI